MVKKALLIGINYLTHPGYALKGCIDDVKNMENMLIYKYNYEKENIVILTDESAILPTKVNIINNLNTLIYDSGSLEEIWIHYSGHGTQIGIGECNNPSSIIVTNSFTNTIDNNGNKCFIESTLIPLDYEEEGHIIADDLFAMVCNIKCPAVLLFDCCHSGNICELPCRIEVDNSGNSILIWMENHKIENPDIYVFGGCKEIQTCADEFDNEIIEHVGAFTTIFLKCLYENQTDILIGDFYKKILKCIKDEGFVQDPVLTSSSDKWDKIITKTEHIDSINRVFSSRDNKILR